LHGFRTEATLDSEKADDMGVYTKYLCCFFVFFKQKKTTNNYKKMET